MHEFGVAVDLAAGEPGGERMVRVALDPHDAAVLDVREQGAHIGTIMGTNGADRGHGAGLRS